MKDQKVAIVKYNAGNIQSVIYALERLGISPILTDKEEELKSADKVIFPGVGEASSAMKYINDHGLGEILPNLTQPFLGICIGQQLMCSHSEEGNATCLNIFPLEVKKFDNHDEKGTHFKVPHMGWNKIRNLKGPLFEGIEEEHAYVYYVHSFYCEYNEDYTIATTEYANAYSGGLHKDNFFAVQFHPEKSGKIGEQVLRNFLSL